MSAIGSERGMTLLEVLVAVAILSLITALGFPQLEHRRQALLARSAAFVLSADLGRTRAAAIASASETVLLIHPDGRAYTVAGRVRAAPAGVVFAGGAVRFFSDGTQAGGDLAVLAGPRRIAIAVDPVSGRVAMEDRP